MSTDKGHQKRQKERVRKVRGPGRDSKIERIGGE